MGEIVVVNLRTKVEKGWTRISVARPSILGNPFYMKDKTEFERVRVIAQHKSWLWMQMQKMGDINTELIRIAKMKEDIELACYCKPLSCHGDTLRDAILWIRKNRL